MSSCDVPRTEAGSAAAAFAALGAEARLNLFVRLLRADPAGLTREEVEDPQALDALRRAGLVRVQTVGRLEVFHAEADVLIGSLAGVFRQARVRS